jgi:hypothetical protein
MSKLRSAFFPEWTGTGRGISEQSQASRENAPQIEPQVRRKERASSSVLDSNDKRYLEECREESQSRLTLRLGVLHVVLLKLAV